jgi:hypothetical protein
MFELSRESDVPLVEQICERLTQLVRPMNGWWRAA